MVGTHAELCTCLCGCETNRGGCRGDVETYAHVFVENGGHSWKEGEAITDDVGGTGVVGATAKVTLRLYCLVGDIFPRPPCIGTHPVPLAALPTRDSIISRYQPPLNDGSGHAREVTSPLAPIATA